jgi:hypothetical protein
MSQFDILFPMPSGGRNADDMGMPPSAHERESQMTDLTPKPPNDSGSSNFAVKWVIETPAGWIAAWNKDAIFAYEHLIRAEERELRRVLQELRTRLHAAGRRPEECYDMSLIDDALAIQSADATSSDTRPESP